jgi:hypothetical protein
MRPKIEVVTYNKAKRQKLKLIFGVQFGVWGYVVRVGLYY